MQEMIDVCDFAVGLSRQLHGLTMPSERPGHRMMEQWHPLGPIGVITAFNFPVAVWAWNAMLALVCGDSVVWKPSEKTPLTALACHNIAMGAIEDFHDGRRSVGVVVGLGPDIGQAIAASEKLPLISATGSVRMGRSVATVVAQRWADPAGTGRNNGAMILTPAADMDLAIRAITFAAAGTAGQRCTTLRRLIVHHSIRRAVTDRLIGVFARLRVGNPLEDGVLVGPLIDEHRGQAMQAALTAAVEQGGKVHGGQRVTENVPPGGVYVRPAIVEMPSQTAICLEETFAPILYVIGYETLAEAIEIHNAVPQGLSSAIFTNDMREAETFLSPAGSDCGIANVNIGTSGAEIGGAFGGEKWTGGGRESGSDSWKAYMRPNHQHDQLFSPASARSGDQFRCGMRRLMQVRTLGQVNQFRELLGILADLVQQPSSHRRRRSRALRSHTSQGHPRRPEAGQRHFGLRSVPPGIFHALCVVGRWCGDLNCPRVNTPICRW